MTKVTTGIKFAILTLVFFKGKLLVLLLEIKMRGKHSSLMGDRYVESDATKKIFTHKCHISIWNGYESTSSN